LEGELFAFVEVKFRDVGEDTQQDFAEDARHLMEVIELVGEARGLGTSVKVSEP
jgi:hypothetical protein